MKVNRLSEADHALVSAAVTAAERGTDGEIVTIVTDRSDAYHDVALHWALAAMLIVLSTMAAFPAIIEAWVQALSGGWIHEPGLGTTLFWVIVTLIIVFLVVRSALAWMPLRMLLTPARTKEQRVRRRAIRYFKVGAESRTMRKTGILIYLSMAEHRAEIVADEAIHQAVSPEAWGDAMAAMIDLVRQGRPGEGMAAAVEKVGLILATHFPRNPNDINELPDRLIEL